MEKKYILKFHPAFFEDLKSLEKNDQNAVSKQIEKIEADPTRFKHLHGRGNCYSIRTGNLRIVYTLKRELVILLTVDNRDRVYNIYPKRLFDLD